MKLKIGTLILPLLSILICGCFNSEAVKNDKIIKKIVIYEADSIGNEFKKSIAEYDKNGKRIVFIVFDMNGNITFSEKLKNNDNKNVIEYYDSINGNYKTINKIEDGKVIYRNTLYEDKSKSPVEAYIEYDSKNNITSIIAKYEGIENISKIEYIYDMDIIIKQIQENISDDIRSVSVTENRYIDKKLREQILTSSVRDIEQLKIVREYRNNDKTFDETRYTFNKLTERNEYKDGLLLSSLKYKDNEIQNEIEYKFEFDKYGNWILKKKFYKGKSDIKLELLTETKRVIDYY